VRLKTDSTEAACRFHCPSRKQEQLTIIQRVEKQIAGCERTKKRCGGVFQLSHPSTVTALAHRTEDQIRERVHRPLADNLERLHRGQGQLDRLAFNLKKRL
jgi:hypothetical protein